MTACAAERKLDDSRRKTRMRRAVLEAIGSLGYYVNPDSASDIANAVVNALIDGKIPHCKFTKKEDMFREVI